MIFNKLRVYWGRMPGEKKKDLVFHGLKSDARFLLQVFSEETLKELEERGYDIATFKFSIEKKHVPNE